MSDCPMKTSIIISTQQAGVFFLPRVNIFMGGNFGGVKSQNQGSKE